MTSLVGVLCMRSNAVCSEMVLTSFANDFYIQINYVASSLERYIQQPKFVGLWPFKMSLKAYITILWFVVAKI